MEGFGQLGRRLLVLGCVLALAGLLLILAEKAGFRKLGRLPGDIVFSRGNLTFFFPIVTCLLLSVLLTLLLNWIFRK